MRNKAIAALEKQLADHKARRRERFEHIYRTHADNEAAREAAIEKDDAVYSDLQDRLLEALHQENRELMKQTKLLRIEREIRECAYAATPAQAMKQRLAAKLAGRNTTRAAVIL